MAIPKASLDLPPEISLDRIYCPVCGTVVHSQDASPSCSHIIFSYIDVAGDFDTLSPDAKELWDQITETDEDPDDPVGTLVKRLESKSAFCLEVSAGCAPGGSRLSLGIDFSPK